MVLRWPFCSNSFAMKSIHRAVKTIQVTGYKTSFGRNHLLVAQSPPARFNRQSGSSLVDLRNCQCPVRSTISKYSTMAVSQVRQNFHEDSENGINKQINMELYASYVYLSMAYYFDRDDVALHGIGEYFKKSSDEEREHAQKLMKYLNKRGGRIILYDVKQPPKNDWSNAEDAFVAALQLEKDVNTCLLSLHQIGTIHNDANLCDFLESEFLQEQVDSIKAIGDQLTNIRRVGKEGLGIYIFDKEFKS